MGEKPKCVLFRTCASVLGIISGCSIFATFLAYHNYHAAIWGLLTAVFAAVNAMIYTSYRSNTLHLRYTPESLRMTKVAGIVFSIATLIASIVYFVLMAVLKQGYKIEGDGYAPAGVFALLALKWTVMMIFSGKTFEKILISDQIIENGAIADGEPTQYNSIK